MDEKDKGEWAETAEEGVVPDELGGDEDSAVLGRTTGSSEPATEEGIDRSAGDAADATSDGGAEPPAGAEPDLKDAGAAQRRDAQTSPSVTATLTVRQTAPRTRTFLVIWISCIEAASTVPHFTHT